MYEMATGKLPYAAQDAGEFARLIVEGQPVSPKSVNPDIDHAILNVIGQCLYKDPFRRYKEVKLVLDDIVRADPEAQRFANELSKSALPGPRASTTPTVVMPLPSGVKSAPSAPDPTQRHVILFIASVGNYEALESKNPAAAAKATAYMQQILGEAVYLFDGQIVDPFGKHMIAELPSVENAIEAARKGEFDFSSDQQSGEPVDVRLLPDRPLVLTAHDVLPREPRPGQIAAQRRLYERAIRR